MYVTTQSSYDAMVACWSFEAEGRPTFGDLMQKLDSIGSLGPFQTDTPFPPEMPTAPAGARSHSADVDTSAGGTVKVFTTDASASFRRSDGE